MLRALQILLQIPHKREIGFCSRYDQESSLVRPVRQRNRCFHATPVDTQRMVDREQFTFMPPNLRALSYQAKLFSTSVGRKFALVEVMTSGQLSTPWSLFSLLNLKRGDNWPWHTCRNAKWTDKSYGTSWVVLLQNSFPLRRPWWTFVDIWSKILWCTRFKSPPQ